MKGYDYKVTAAGRINIIGEHIDYCGGKVMPAALSLKNTVYVRPNGTNQINLSWTTLPDKVTLDIDKLDSYKGLKYGNYQAGAALMWQRAGHKIIGCDMLHDCTVPFGSGLSSSAAIEVSTIAALATLAGEQLDTVDIVLKSQQAEREYTGVNCGIMDQYASACGKKDSVMLLDCSTLECEYLPLKLGNYSLVITNCKKPHNLVESKYNERRAETEEALKLLQTKLTVSCLAEVTLEQFEEYKEILPAVIRKRTQHVIEECERVRLAVNALKAGDINTLGKLLNQSHYDHNFCLNGERVATAQGLESGITMEIYSDMAGVQFYVGKPAEYNGKGGYGFCLEPQFYPNAINVQEFQKPILKTGESITHTINFKFI